jgi:hypothetical protein
MTLSLDLLANHLIYLSTTSSFWFTLNSSYDLPLLCHYPRLLPALLQWRVQTQLMIILYLQSIPIYLKPWVTMTVTLIQPIQQLSNWRKDYCKKSIICWGRTISLMYNLYCPTSRYHMFECQEQRVINLSWIWKNGSTTPSISLDQEVHLNQHIELPITSSNFTRNHSLLPARLKMYLSSNQWVQRYSKPCWLLGR